jgi:hypothetical protein
MYDSPPVHCQVAGRTRTTADVFISLSVRAGIKRGGSRGGEAGQGTNARYGSGFALSGAAR